jgi:DNA (cytosine-5)-methyltransferase 1
LSGLGSGGPDDNDAQAGRIIAHPVARRGRDGESEFEMGEDETMFALRAGNGGSSRQPMVTHSLTSEGHDASEDGTGRGTPMVVRMREGKPGGGKDPLLSEDMSLTLGQANDQTLFGTLRGFGHGWQGQHNDDAQKAGMVRRLTPVECCRLQGFPDDWLGEPNVLPDSPRYAAMGDAVTVNVAEWIGRRLMEAM